jgi:hypothetical protein
LVNINQMCLHFDWSGFIMDDPMEINDAISSEVFEIDALLAGGQNNSRLIHREMLKKHYLIPERVCAYQMDGIDEFDIRLQTNYIDKDALFKNPTPDNVYRLEMSFQLTTYEVCAHREIKWNARRLLENLAIDVQYLLTEFRAAIKHESYLRHWPRVIPKLALNPHIDIYRGKDSDCTISRHEPMSLNPNVTLGILLNRPNDSYWGRKQFVLNPNFTRETLREINDLELEVRATFGFIDDYDIGVITKEKLLYYCSPHYIRQKTKEMMAKISDELMHSARSPRRITTWYENILDLNPLLYEIESIRWRTMEFGQKKIIIRPGPRLRILGVKKITKPKHKTRELCNLFQQALNL